MVFNKLFSRKKKSEKTDSSSSLISKILAEKNTDTRYSLIKSVEDNVVLEQLAQDKDKTVRQQAQSILLSQLMPNNELPTNATTAILTRIISYTNDTGVAQKAILQIEDEQERFTIAKNHQVARVRLTAAETLTSPELIQSLYESAQGRDKAVYRLCKDRVAEIQQKEQAHQALLNQIDYLQENLQQLIRLSDSPDFSGRFQVLQQRWTSISPLPDTLDSRGIPNLLQQAEEIFSEQKATQEKAAEIAKVYALQQEVVAQTKHQLDNLVENSSNELQTLITASEQAWRVACANQEAEQKTNASFDNLMATAKQALAACTHQEAHKLEPADKPTPEVVQAAKDLIKTINWPRSLSAPVWLKELTDIAGQKIATPENVKEKNTQPPNIDKDKLKEQINKIKQSMQAMEKALDEGHAANAGRSEKQINTLLSALSSDSTRQLNSQLKNLSSRLRELRDWQGYAVTPKKEALCEQMDALVGIEMHPETLADKIKLLQTEWKELGYSGNDKELWERFHQAADKAFEPCKVFYEEEANKRAELVKLREALISELEHYEAAMNWESADWKVVQSTLDKARDTFRTYSPVDRHAHNKTQKAFKNICDRIYEHVKVEYDKNVALKKALVARAEKTLSNEDIQQATDQIKQIQQEWKSIGLTPRGADQKLWAQLRSHADAVFNKLGEQRQARKAEINETVTNAESILATAKDAMNQTDAEARSALQEASDQLKEIDLPKTAYQRISKELEQLHQELESRVTQAQQAATTEKWNNLYTALADKQQGNEIDTSNLPKSINASWFEQTADPATSAQEICILMEILADTDSPANDQSKRMELQVQRLAQGMGKGLDKEEERAQLVKQWLTVEASEQELERFVDALKGLY